MFTLTTNDKTIKLWKISDKPVKKSEQTNKKITSESELKIPKLKIVDDGVNPVMKRSYPNLHNYHINSISHCATGEGFLSSDDLKIYIWDLETTKCAYNVVDLKPDNFEELSEVITASKFHPTSDNQFIFSTSKGVIRIGDLRANSCCDKAQVSIEDKESTAQKNFFTDIVASISDITYSSNGRYIFSRDFLNVKVWDVNMPKKPIAITAIFEPLKSKLCELYENEGIFEKFSVSVSKDANYFMTGMFNSNFHVSDRNGDNNNQFELNFDKKTVSKHIPKKFYEPLGSKYDYTRKVLKGAWHPTENIIAMACLNCLYFYHQT
jgi:serine/threonine-protein phosphatase 2A regulatory subunit B